MTFDEAIEILNNGKRFGVAEENAIEVLKSEIENSRYPAAPLSKLVSLLLHSKNPLFSYQILRVIFESDDSKVETAFATRSNFLNEKLGSTSAKDGVFKCMVALARCTGVVGDDEK